MHFHLPKPLHGWRAFVGEVGVIVLGVLIAIGLGQIVDAVRWRAEVRDARAALTDDMAQSNRVFAYRVAAHDCVARRLDRLNDIIERSAKHQAVPALGDVFPDIGNALFKNAWETSRAAQTLVHFDRKTLRLYGSYYLQLDNIGVFILREGEDWGVLRVLSGDPGRLGPTDIASLRIAAMHASFENDIIAGIAQDELDNSKELGVAVPEPDRRRLAEVCRPLLPNLKAS
ncbi:MAG: hypothetical protein ABI454_12615 [Sphingomicrobium sp.]